VKGIHVLKQTLHSLRSTRVCSQNKALYADEAEQNTDAQSQALLEISKFKEHHPSRHSPPVEETTRQSFMQPSQVILLLDRFDSRALEQY
jgi:hypothetical protein